MSLRAALALLALTAGASGCAAARGDARAHAETGQSAGRVVVGQPLPEIELASLEGRGLKLSSFRGKVVLLDVWASWCEPCKEELPWLDDVAARLRGRGVEVLAVSVDQEVANVRTFLRRKSGGWNLKVFHDPAGQIAERLQPPRMPTSYVLDRGGVVRMVNEGYHPKDAQRLEAKLAELSR